MAAAVILRQYEEIEEDMGDDDEGGLDFREQVNFLAITQTIIDSMISSPLNQSLATAAYWIAIRQEVYCALTRERTLSMRFSAEDWQNASVANTLIMLVGEVAKWCWGDKSPEEWGMFFLFFLPFVSLSVVRSQTNSHRTTQHPPTTTHANLPKPPRPNPFAKSRQIQRRNLPHSLVHLRRPSNSDTTPRTSQNDSSRRKPAFHVRPSIPLPSIILILDKQKRPPLPPPQS